jgi:hypothetical protein
MAAKGRRPAVVKFELCGLSARALDFSPKGGTITVPLEFYKLLFRLCAILHDHP